MRSFIPFITGTCLLISLLSQSFIFGQVNFTKSITKTIVLDPGHGGKDHGCSGHNSREKEIVLSVAKKLQKQIQLAYPAIDVLFTRDQDVFVPLANRSSMANEAQADLFISLHCNAIHVDHVHGSESYVMGLHNSNENLDVAKRENNSILLEDDFIQTYGGYTPNSPEGHIILSLYQNAFLDKSIQLAQYIEKSLTSHANRKSRGVKQAGFVVLRQTTMPSVLVEMGFLTHSTEEAYLLSDQGQNEISDALFNAIHLYVESEKKDQLATIKQVPKAIDLDKITESTITTHIDQKVGQNSTVQLVDYKTDEKIVEKPSIGRVPIKNEITKVTYHIQIAAAKNKTLNISEDDQWSGIENIDVKKENGLYKYQVVGYRTFDEATEAKKVLRAKGFKAAFIVPYVNDQKINIDSAKQIELEKRKKDSYQANL